MGFYFQCRDDVVSVDILWLFLVSEPCSVLTWVFLTGGRNLILADLLCKEKVFPLCWNIADIPGVCSILCLLTHHPDFDAGSLALIFQCIPHGSQEWREKAPTVHHPLYGIWEEPPPILTLLNPHVTRDSCQSLWSSLLWHSMGSFYGEGPVECIDKGMRRSSQEHCLFPQILLLSPTLSFKAQHVPLIFFCVAHSLSCRQERHSLNKGKNPAFGNIK